MAIFAVLYNSCAFHIATIEENLTLRVIQTPGNGSLCAKSGSSLLGGVSIDKWQDQQILNVQEIGKSAVRKSHWFLLPVILITTSLGYIDRSNVAYAAVTLKKVLRMTNSQYVSHSSIRGSKSQGICA